MPVMSLNNQHLLLSSLAGCTGAELIRICHEICPSGASEGARGVVNPSFILFAVHWVASLVRKRKKVAQK